MRIAVKVFSQQFFLSALCDIILGCEFETILTIIKTTETINEKIYSVLFGAGRNNCRIIYSFNSCFGSFRSVIRIDPGEAFRSIVFASLLFACGCSGAVCRLHDLKHPYRRGNCRYSLREHCNPFGCPWKQSSSKKQMACFFAALDIQFYHYPIYS